MSVQRNGLQLMRASVPGTSSLVRDILHDKPSRTNRPNGAPFYPLLSEHGFLRYSEYILVFLNNMLSAFTSHTG